MSRWLTFPAALGLAVVAAGAAGASGQGAGERPVSPSADLLAPVCFYQSYAVGKRSESTGLLRWDRRAASFEPLCWPELITSSVVVDRSGRWAAIACGNGVMVSRDGGQNWRLTGGWEMAEVQRVAIDRQNPRHLWAATAYGLWEAGDILAGDPWRRLTPPDAPFFCSDVVQDASDPKRLWVASEEGLFESRDSGRTLERRGPAAAVRRVVETVGLDGGPSRIWAASDGGGLLESKDDGRSWQAVAGLSDVVFSVAVSTKDPRRLACGTMEGVSLSDDGGAHWDHSAAGLPEGFFVLGLAFDPAVENRLVAAGTDGLFESGDKGLTWKRLGLEGALVRDVLFARLSRDEAVPPSQEPGGLTFEGAAADRGAGDSDEHRPANDEAFGQRREEMLEQLEGRFEGREPGKLGFFGAALAARDPERRSRAFEALGRLLEKPGHSMFFSLPAIGCYLHLRRELDGASGVGTNEGMPPALEEQFARVLTGSPCYRGDTENHWVMHYTSLLLAAQTWPRTSPAGWYMHRDTQSLYDEAKGWLVHWAQLSASKGQGEFDSPHYMFMYVTPMLLLYDFARDAEVKRLAGMMLDLLLADYLTESLDGAYCGGHSRSPGHVVEETTDNRVSAYHYLYAGGITLPRELHGWMVPAVLSGYRPPREFTVMANDRSRPFVHTEVKRVRNVIRYGRELNPPVYKYDFMTALYCLGSLQGGILQPIQQHTWDVTWLGRAPNSVLFTLHPFVSGRELGMFFPEEARYLTRSVGYQKGSYVSPDKWVSSSPYEKIFQHRNVALVLYRVPPGKRFAHVDLYWPHGLERSEEQGWFFGRDGAFHLACRATREGSWSEEGDHDRFRCKGQRAGFVVVADAGDFEIFRREILASGDVELTGHPGQDSSDLTLRYRPPAGPRLELSWSDAWGKIDGKPAEFPRDRLYSGPYIESRLGLRVIILKGGGSRRTLDFNTFTILEQPADR